VSITDLSEPINTLGSQNREDAMELKFNPGWEDEVARVALANMQGAVDAVADEHLGHPAKEVRPALEQSLAEAKATMPSDWLDGVADKISQGQRVIIRDGR
jgi:hypothetical protein